MKDIRRVDVHVSTPADGSGRLGLIVNADHDLDVAAQVCARYLVKIAEQWRPKLDRQNRQELYDAATLLNVMIRESE